MKHIKAKKSLGQNFLIDHEALLNIAHTIPVTGQNIIEVGPGYGALTDFIIEQSPHSLDLVELDSDMIPILTEKYTSLNIAIHHIDVLQFIPKYEEYSVIANIPYYITSPILFHFLYHLKNTPKEMVIMMQKEVGEKILEGRRNKNPHHSFFSLSLEQACENIEIIRYVPRESFDPAPKVDSIVLRFTAKNERNQEEEGKLMSLWKIAFVHPRKTLLSNLKCSQYDVNKIERKLIDLGYDIRVRAEALKREDWIFLL